MSETLSDSMRGTCCCGLILIVFTKSMETVRQPWLSLKFVWISNSLIYAGQAERLRVIINQILDRLVKWSDADVSNTSKNNCLTPRISRQL